MYKTPFGKKYHLTFGCFGATVPAAFPIASSSTCVVCDICKGRLNPKQKKALEDALASTSNIQQKKKLSEVQADGTLIFESTIESDEIPEDAPLFSNALSEVETSAFNNLHAEDFSRVKAICDSAGMSNSYKHLPIALTNAVVKDLSDEELTGLIQAAVLLSKSGYQSVMQDYGNSKEGMQKKEDLAKTRYQNLSTNAKTIFDQIGSQASRRSAGWMYAKRSGHENEKKVAERLTDSEELQQKLIQAAKKTGKLVGDVHYGGINEKNVDCILGGTTKSKGDIHFNTDTNETVVVSLKKDTNSQAFLISVDRFVAGFTKIYGKAVPDDVQRGLHLFFGGADDVQGIIDEYGNAKRREQETRQQRLCHETLEAYDNDNGTNICDAMLRWFEDNAEDVCDYALARGLIADEEQSADLLLYMNLVDEDKPLKEIINISEVKDAISNQDVSCSFGKRYGGTSIELPFGSVQMHQGKMQIRHNLRSIKSVLAKANSNKT